MKKLYFLLCLIFTLCSCAKQNINKDLPYEKVYVVEWRWTFYEEDNGMKFRVTGFSELDKNFNLQRACQISEDQYTASNSLIADSLKEKISEIINSYPTDSTFLSKGKCRIYDGNSSVFIFQKNDSNFVRIFFEPKFLPQDLQFLYNCLYENDCTQEHTLQVKKNQYEELLTKFKNIIVTENGIVPPPPLFLKTIQFTPPVIDKKRHTKRQKV